MPDPEVVDIDPLLRPVVPPPPVAGVQADRWHQTYNFVLQGLCTVSHRAWLDLSIEQCEERLILLEAVAYDSAKRTHGFPKAVDPDAAEPDENAGEPADDATNQARWHATRDHVLLGLCAISVRTWFVLSRERSGLRMRELESLASNAAFRIHRHLVQPPP